MLFPVPNTRAASVLFLAAALVFTTAACRKKKKSPTAQKPAAGQVIPKTRLQIPAPRDELSKKIEALTGAHTRVVWNEYQERGDADPYSKLSNSKLMGVDTRDGLGSRDVLSGTGNYTRPILSTNGKTILFTRRSREQNKEGKWIGRTNTYRTDWAGAAPIELAEGQAVDAWRDPASGTEWIYAARRFRNSRSAGTVATELVRFQLDDPAKEELLFDDSQMSPDNMQVSRDGTRICGLFPWPHGGVLNYDGKIFSVMKLQTGCWPSLAPDNSGVSWVFDGDHKSAMCFAENGARSWELKFNAPGINRHQTYHPRWSNHPRFITITGPYLETGEAGNVISLGGARAQVFLGRLSARADNAEHWVQVSDNNLACSYPDAWIEGGESANLVIPSPSKNTAPVAATAWPANSEGLLFLWRDLATQNTWRGRDGKMNEAKLEAQGTARFGRSGELLPDSGRFEIEQEADTASALFLHLKEKPEFTFEALVIPPTELDATSNAEGLLFASPALRISTQVRNLVIAVSKAGVSFTTPDKPFHLVVQQRGEGISVFINGQQTPTSAAAALTPGTSTAMTFGGNNWRGGLKHLAFYDRAITLDEIAKNAAVMLAQINALPPPAARVRLKARLVETSSVPTAQSIEPYTRALIACVYEIESVISGDFTDKRVLVKHWAMLDRRTTVGFPREKGRSYELTLERDNDHAELRGERVMDDTGVFDLQAWLDVTPPSLPQK